jgi:bifunctional non-homologous end joining protein LigD
VLNGEIAWLDADGRPQFYDLLRRRCDPVFYAFDVLWLDGTDLRERPLIERKRILRSLVPEQSPSVLYADHINGRGMEFFRLACQHDLEGVVAKLRDGKYGEGWYKIRNPAHSQYEGRRELFERRRAVGVGPSPKQTTTGGVHES